MCAAQCLINYSFTVSLHTANKKLSRIEPLSSLQDIWSKTFCRTLINPTSFKRNHARDLPQNPCFVTFYSGHTVCACVLYHGRRFDSFVPGGFRSPCYLTLPFFFLDPRQGELCLRSPRPFTDIMLPSKAHHRTSESHGSQAACAHSKAPVATKPLNEKKPKKPRP